MTLSSASLYCVLSVLFTCFAQPSRTIPCHTAQPPGLPRSLCSPGTRVGRGEGMELGAGRGVLARLIDYRDDRHHGHRAERALDAFGHDEERVLDIRVPGRRRGSPSSSSVL
jgi:hypothetical protein